MSETVELRLYSPLQIDIINRDAPGRAIPFQAVSYHCRSEYTRIIMNAFRAIQSLRTLETLLPPWTRIGPKYVERSSPSPARWS